MERQGKSCPFVKVGDVVTVRKNKFEQRPRQNVIVMGLVFNKYHKGGCEARGQELKLILASNNEIHHPTDTEGVDCEICPCKYKVDIEQPDNFAKRYWEQTPNGRKLLKQIKS